MLKVKGILAAAAIATLGMVGSAKAASISFGGYSGPITIKLSNADTGVIYSGSDGTYNTPAGIASLGQDTSHLGSTFAGEDAWGVVVVSGIYKGLNAAAIPSNALYLAGDPSHQGNLEISGIFWGQQDTFVKLSNGGTTEEIHSKGVQAAFFVDDTPDFDSSAGPDGRTNVGLKPTYSSVTDGTLLWTFDSTTGFSGAGGFTADPSGEFFTSVGVSNGTVTGVNGSGGFAAVTATNDYGTGAQNNLLGSAVTVKFTGTGFDDPFANDTTHSPNWLISSQDPINATAIAPLPTSAAMGGLVIAGMMGMAVKRRRGMQA